MISRDILHSINFSEFYRDQITLSDSTKVRLDASDSKIKLKADSDGKYSTDSNLWAKSQFFWPRKGIQWQGFFSDSYTPTDTSLGYKINNGTNDYYWNGASWVIAGASDWNTEIEIADNISSFDHRKIAVVVNLVTTDETVTPTISQYFVGYTAKIVFMEQWVFRTIVPNLRNNVRPLSGWVITQKTTGTTIDLDNHRQNTPFDITDVAYVYNYTDDSDLETNILSSYNPTTKVITLNTSVDAGKKVWLEFEYKPVVAVNTSVDYLEVAKVPAIIIENLRVEKSIRHGYNNELVNKGDVSKTISYEPPWQCKLKGDIKILTASSADDMAMFEEIVRYISDNQSINIAATDEYVDWFITDYYSRDSGAENNDLRTSGISFEMRWLKAWLRAKKTSANGVYSISGFKTTGNVDIEI
jgi:hypothetical protein